MATPKEQKAYRVDTSKKVITIDDSVKPNAKEKKDIQMYLEAGYKLRHKSVLKSNQAKERAKSQITNEAIIKELAKDEASATKYLELVKEAQKNKTKLGAEAIKDLAKKDGLLVKYHEKKSAEGFFSARKWYKEEKEKAQ